MVRERLIWADSLKGILIVLVVLGHAIQHAYGDACEINHLWNGIYSFHMAAFIAVSGYFAFHSSSEKVMWKDVCTLIWRRFQQLMIPFLLWSVLSVLINTGFSMEVMIKCILFPHLTFWFLWVLFFISAIFVLGSWIAERWKIRSEIVTLFTCAMLIGIMIKFEPRMFGFQYIAFYYLIYVIGYNIHKYNEVIISNRYYVILPLLFCWCFLAWNWQMHTLPSWLHGIPLPESIMQYAYRFITAIVAIYILLAVSPFLLSKKSLLNVPFISLGKISLGIYTVHIIWIGKISRFCRSIGFDDTMIIVISFISALFVSWVIVLILNKWKVSSRYLLGKV